MFQPTKNCRIKKKIVIQKTKLCFQMFNSITQLVLSSKLRQPQSAPASGVRLGRGGEQGSPKKKGCAKCS